jgi:hypothetical protein
MTLRRRRWWDTGKKRTLGTEKRTRDTEKTNAGMEKKRMLDTAPHLELERA